MIVRRPIQTGLFCRLDAAAAGIQDHYILLPKYTGPKPPMASKSSQRWTGITGSAPVLAPKNRQLRP
jgi:hypothetical protein